MAITKATASSIAPAAKGDLVVGSATNDAAVLGVGSNDQVLTADSSTATGVKWATPSSGGMTLISTTSLSGASVTLSSIPSTYTNLQLIIQGVTAATANGKLIISPNAVTNIAFSSGLSNISTQQRQVGDYISYPSGNNSDRTNSENSSTLDIMRYASADAQKSYLFFGGGKFDDFRVGHIQYGHINTSSAISSLVISYSGGNLSSGTAYLYGVK
jgi:hypothetical protein